MPHCRDAEILPKIFVAGAFPTFRELCLCLLVARMLAWYVNMTIVWRWSNALR